MTIFMKSIWIALLLLATARFVVFCAAVEEPAAIDAKSKLVEKATDAPADHQGSRQLVKQADDGTVVFPHKNTVGYWTKLEDWASWEFEIAKPGKFAVEILQGCGTGSGNAEVEFSVGDQTLKVTVQDTGGFQNFVARDIGTFKLTKPGRYTLTVKPKTKPGVAVMDLRQVTLKPVEK